MRTFKIYSISNFQTVFLTRVTMLSIVDNIRANIAASFYKYLQDIPALTCIILD